MKKKSYLKMTSIGGEFPVIALEPRDSPFTKVIVHSNDNFKIYNFEHIFCMFFLVGGQNMYMNTLLHCHYCIQIITNHLQLSKVTRPIHTIPGINAHLLYPILCLWKYSIIHKLLYYPLCIFGYFHGNQCCVASCHYFYTWGFYRKWKSLVWWDPCNYINILSVSAMFHFILALIVKCLKNKIFFKISNSNSNYFIAL